MHKFRISIPDGASKIIQSLQAAGFEAYVVGGCVRDSLLGLTPHDWDVCTSATPEEIESVFAGEKIVETGLKHGTVTVFVDDIGYEITTFRVEGRYSDGRRPDNVEFVTDLMLDLSRRDFTMNAMAYNDRVGLIDPFGGVQSIGTRTISCVRNADERFNEDALRILRAMRFASTYGFSIDGQTSTAIHQNRTLLKRIANERINVELCKMLLGKGVLDVLQEYSDVIATIIPEIQPCIGFDQKNKYHQYTVYEHIAHAVANYGGDDVCTAVALLLHDIGKPSCYSEDENGGHFYGHGEPSAKIAGVVLDRLRFDKRSQHDIVELVLYHDAQIEPMPRAVRRWLNKLGEVQFRRLMDVRRADILAHRADTASERMQKRDAALALAEDILAEQQCFQLRNLAISGKDVIAAGIPEGKAVGFALNAALDGVMSEAVPNEKQALLDYIKMEVLNHE